MVLQNTKSFLWKLHLLAAGLLPLVGRIADGDDTVTFGELAAFVERTGVDEIMVASAIYDHDARKHSLTLTAGAMADMQMAA